ncbi:MAG: type II and III secretion system protein family protein, partial [Comamonadaceae bacterium]
MTLRVGTQQELVVERGVERIALADEAVAGVAVARKERGSNAARLILT